MLSQAEIETAATEILTEIDADITGGVVPAGIGSFSELHDHVDANDYWQAVSANDDGLTFVNAVESRVAELLKARAA